MQTPANFIRLRSLSFDAAIAGSARTCEVKDGFLIIPVVDTDEALTIIGKLGELPARPEVPRVDIAKDNAENPLKALGATATKLRSVADALESPKVSAPSPHVNGTSKVVEVKPGQVFEVDPSKGVDGFKPVITEKPEAKVLSEDENLFKKNGAPAVNAPGATDEPTTGVRAKPSEKPKAEKKPKADKPARNVVDDVAAHEAATAEPAPKEESAEAPKEEPTEAAAPEEQEERTASGSFDEAYIASAPKLRDIVVHLYENGLKSVDGILAELGTRKDHPLVSKAVVNADRVVRMLDAVGISVSA